MKFETLTYAASSLGFSGCSASGPQETHLSSPTGGLFSARMSDSIAAFLLRVAACFHGCLSSFPSLEPSIQEGLSHCRLTVADSSIDKTSEPLITVRMNRHLSRRMRWLIRRGRVERSGQMRAATAEDKARGNLTPGQCNEYGIRVHGYSRIRTYGLGFTRDELRKIAICWWGLQGSRECLVKLGLCHAPLSPD